MDQSKKGSNFNRFIMESLICSYCKMQFTMSTVNRTKKYISEFYREYDSSMPDENVHRKEEMREDEDDFLMDQSPANSSLFTYGTSPGFLQT